MSKLMLDVGLANELKMAFRRAGYEPSEVKSLAEGNVLAEFLEVVRGRARIVTVEVKVLPVVQAIINTITVLPGLTLAEHIALGKYGWTNPDITSERFPHNPTTLGEWEFDLF